MCKLFGQSPGHYLGIEDPYVRFQVDIACASAFWEDENTKYEDSKKNAGNEADLISQEVAEFQRKLSER